jgi:hypothetical protein
MSAEPCQRSSGNSRHASFIQRGTIAGSRVCCDHQQNPPTPQRDCRGFVSRAADSGGQRNRRGPIFSIGFLEPKLFRAGR